MRRFYVKHADMYLIQVGKYEWFSNNPVYTKDKSMAGKFTDHVYDNIKTKLPKDHTLELVMEKRSFYDWIKDGLIWTGRIVPFIYNKFK